MMVATTGCWCNGSVAIQLSIVFVFFPDIKIMLKNLAHCGEKLYFFSYLESIQPMKYIYIYIYIYK